MSRATQKYLLVDELKPEAKALRQLKFYLGDFW